MLDENLPTFYLRASSDGIKHNASVLLSQHGSDATPDYSLRHPDPALPGSKNRYAVALYDSYNPEILFGEVLLIPEWTQPNLSQEQIRLNGGVPPPPQPILPTEFTIQLYNPDQQVLVKLHAGTWKSDAYWEFVMPQQSFRQPSASVLDRTQSDPTASENTPKLAFRWKKEGKLSKDYVCSLSGKSTNPDGSKRKNREPDITIGIFKHFKEITIYEPNLQRVDMEDPKGLEVVILLGAVVIREVFNSNMRETFNITESPRRNSAENSTTTSANPNLLPRRRHHQNSSPDTPHNKPPSPHLPPSTNRPPLPMGTRRRNRPPPQTSRRRRTPPPTRRSRRNKTLKAHARRRRAPCPRKTKGNRSRDGATQEIIWQGANSKFPADRE
ncbi:hypothetical protein ABVK25_000174 [Lepraria finkii]|uniref:Uncharacterized protein n=1 Tax=Lepraria finkii TaxID=1340010 RepID=A0ABR4BM56_9LECA